MQIFFAFLGATFGLFLWMYLLSYMLYRGVSHDFIDKTRLGLLRGMCVAILFIIVQYIPGGSDLIGRDWVVFPALFFLFSLPQSWRQIHLYTLLPLFFGLGAWFIFSFTGDNVTLLFWSPFQEEMGKWYQSITTAWPAVMTPFVSIGFGFVENTRYYMHEMTFAQVLGRTLFSLPLHIFVGLVSFWILLAIPSRFFGVLFGLTLAILIHMLYNWSLLVSPLLTLPIMIGGYMFYGWSLENGWWRKPL